jgi:hypothetical protein
MAIADDPRATQSQEQADLKEDYRLFVEGKPVTDPDLIRRTPSITVVGKFGTLPPPDVPEIPTDGAAA